MSFSSGTYSLPGPALNTGDTVSATENNTFRNDVATAFNLTWLRNGTAAATADIPMGGFSFTNCAAVGSNASLLLKSNNGTTAVTIDTAQNVGVGVTPSAWGGGGSKAIDLTNSSSIYTQSGPDIGFANNGYYNSGWFYKSTGAAMLARASNGAFQWFTAPSGTAGNPITFTQAMTLDASGNLLINTASPLVSNTGRANITLNGSIDGVFAFGIGGVNSAYLYNNSSLLEINAQGSRYIQFTTNGSERARIDSSGRLLVNTTSAATTNANAFYFDPAPGYGGNANIMHVNGTSSGVPFLSFGYNGSNIGSITQNGTTGVLYNLTSDYRLKNDQQPLTGAKEFIMALQPKKWQWWDGSGEGVGFIAHEFMEVAKYSGHGEKDAVDENGNIIPQSIQPSSSEVMANLVALLQEQQAIITQLQADVAALKG